LLVVATDDEGLSTRSEYVAEYRRPLLRTPWVLAVLGSLPLIGVAGAVAARARRRRRLRRRRFNPYIAGAPVLDEDLFFGRDALVDRILDTIHNNSLLLHGERRIGKTSLLHHVKRRLEGLDDPEYAFFPVYVDLQGTPEERFFATLAEDVLHELSSRLEGLDAADVEDDGYGYRELVRDLREVIRQLEAGTERRVKVVLLVDEVDELNAYDPRINQRLRSLFMKSFAEHLVAVVAGVRIRREWEQESSPWYNFFEEIEVLPLPRNEAARLVTEPIQGMFEFDHDAIERILEHTGGRPYPIQKLCVAVVNRLHEAGRRRATAADVDQVMGAPEL
jgi:hypothetical protein